MRNQPGVYSWYTNLLRIRDLHNIPTDAFESSQFRQRIRQCIDQKFWENWTVNPYAYETGAPVGQGRGYIFDTNINRTRRSLIAQLRTSDTWSMVQNREAKAPCPVCHTQQLNQDWVKHIIFECPPSHISQSSLPKYTQQNRNGMLDWLGMVLDGALPMHLEKVIQSFETWKRRSGR